ncbi:hypothetical protein [Lactiplantibacillus paraxiangfangensis]|uniref:hypothetical protein n=1 Tax=Lactiplantibacillus paraxiangfangensis TaxID=3076224 RepID=UPI0030C705CB
MTENSLNDWDPAKMAQPTEFMDYGEFMLRLKKDLGETSPNFWIFDMQTPHNEDEYQESLRIVKMLYRMSDSTNK